MMVVGIAVANYLYHFKKGVWFNVLVIELLMADFVMVYFV